MKANHTSNESDFKRYWNPNRTYHIAPASTCSGIKALLIRKSIPTWIYRAVRYGELSRYVKDNRGLVLVYNHWYHAVNVLNRERKVAARYDIHGNECTPEEYNRIWADNGKTDRDMIRDPYCCWVSGYKAHFVLETAKGKRETFAYYRPIEEK